MIRILRDLQVRRLVDGAKCGGRNSGNSAQGAVPRVASASAVLGARRNGTGPLGKVTALKPKERFRKKLWPDVR